MAEKQVEENMHRGIPEEVTYKSRKIYAELIKDINLADLLGIIKLASSSIVETLVTEGNLNIEGVAADMMVEYTNTINDIKNVMKINTEIADIIGDGGYSVLAIPFSDMYQYKNKDGLVIIFDNESNKAFSPTVDINEIDKEILDDAHKKIETALSELRKRITETISQQEVSEEE